MAYQPPALTGSIADWADYVKQTHYGPDKRSSRDAHFTIDNFVSGLQHDGVVRPSSIGQDHLNRYVARCKANGNSASTINTKLCVITKLLTTMGNASVKLQPLKVNFVPRPKQSKWWLNEEQAPKLLAWLRGIGQRPALCDLADYIEWTRETGLRVEETLRLLPSDFVNDYTSLIVPGTKNTRSEARIAISKRATEIMRSRLACMVNRADPQPRLFNIAYRDLRDAWQEARKFLCVQDDPTSTLKSLRRSFAAEMMFRGMDGIMLKNLMRHSDMKTTMGYLELVGLADNDRIRRFLDGDKMDALQTPDEEAFIKAFEALGFKVVKL